MRRRKKWRDPEVARYLLAHEDTKRWESDGSSMTLWIAMDGTEMFMMDDDDERAAAVDRFVARRKSISRTELEKELEDS